MSDKDHIEEEGREPLLNPVERVSEMLFGLFMALTFVGAVSVATAGPAEIRTMLAAALGCNLAWGLVDGFVYLVHTITHRGRSLTLAHAVRAADAETGCKLIEASLTRVMASLVSTAEIEAIRGRLVALPSVPDKPTLKRDDLLAAAGVFLIVVLSTFPVALPFVIFKDIGLAMTVSRIIALTMMFLGGLALGRYAGYGSWKAGFIMAGLGTVIVGVIVALGG